MSLSRWACRGRCGPQRARQHPKPGQVRSCVCYGVHKQKQGSTNSPRYVYCVHICVHIWGSGRPQPPAVLLSLLLMTGQGELAPGRVTMKEGEEERRGRCTKGEKGKAQILPGHSPGPCEKREKTGNSCVCCRSASFLVEKRAQIKNQIIICEILSSAAGRRPRS